MKSLTDAVLSLSEKRVSSVELTQECLIEAKKNKNNAFISVCEDSALQEAEESDHRRSTGELISSLDGIPYSLKDLFITKGIRTTAGSRSLFNYIPPYQGGVAGYLKQAGAVLIGKVGCDEYGMGSTNEKTIFGPVLNPLNTDHVAGGSSGGSAASVAEGSSFFSMGTDTGGSVRLPCNFCGLTGLKPTYGRVTRYGQIAYASSLDQASPMAASVQDLAIVMEIISQKDDRDSSQANLEPLNISQELESLSGDYLKGKTLGVDSSFIDACAPKIKEEQLRALDQWKKLGVEVKEITLSHLKYSVSTYYIIATSEASANLARFDGIHYGYRAKTNDHSSLEQTYIDSRTQGFGDEVKKRILLGTFSLSSGYSDQYYAQACKVRRLIANDFQEAFKQVDFIFSPVCATSAFKLGEGIQNPVQMYMNDLYTIPVNLSGLPGLALPFGQDSNGLPTGFQIIGKHFEDAELLKIGHAFQREGK